MGPTLALAALALLAACGSNDPVPAANGMTNGDSSTPPAPPAAAAATCAAAGTEQATCLALAERILAPGGGEALEEAEAALRDAIEAAALEAPVAENLRNLLAAREAFLATQTARTARLKTYENDGTIDGTTPAVTHKQCTANARCKAFLDTLASVPIGGLTPLRRAVTNADFTDEDAPDTAPNAAGFRALLTALANAVEKDLLNRIEVRDHDGGFVARAAVETVLRDDRKTREGAIAQYARQDPPGAAGEEAAHYGVWLDEATDTFTLWYDAPEDHVSVPDELPATTYTGRATYTYTGPAEGYARRGDYSGAFTAQTRLTLDLTRGADAQRLNGTLGNFAFRTSGLAGDTPPSLADWNGVHLEWRGNAMDDTSVFRVRRGGAVNADTLDEAASTWHTILYHEDREDRDREDREKPAAPAGLTGYFDLRFTGDDRAVGAFAATR